MRCWRRPLSVPWTTRRSNPSILKEINAGYSLERLMLKLKLQYFGHLMQTNWLTEKYPDAGKDWRQEERGTTEDEMVGWQHQLTGYEFEQALGDSEGQGSLACCSPWGCKESDTTKQLNWTDRFMDYNKCTTTSVTFQCRVIIFGQLSSLNLESLFMNILEHINHLSQFSHSVVSDSLRPHGL